MNSYLQLKFANEFNEKFNIRLNNYDPDISDQDVNQVMDGLIAEEVFTGKKAPYNKKLSASLVTIEEKEYSLS